MTFLELEALQQGHDWTTLDDLIDARPAWMRSALCREFPSEWWFPGRGESTGPAKAICAACAVRQECLDYAADLPYLLRGHGVWAGTSARERRLRSRAQAA